MMIIILFGVAVFLALIVVCIVYIILCNVNELNSKTCEHCDMYDKTLHTCWLRMDFRYPADSACDHFDRASSDDNPNT